MPVVTGKVSKNGSIITDRGIFIPEDTTETMKFRGRLVHVYGEITTERISSLNLELNFIKIRKIKPVF